MDIIIGLVGHTILSKEDELQLTNEPLLLSEGVNFSTISNN
jgi:hypothetical protein